MISSNLIRRAPLRFWWLNLNSLNLVTGFLVMVLDRANIPAALASLRLSTCGCFSFLDTINVFLLFYFSLICKYEWFDLFVRLRTEILETWAMSERSMFFSVSSARARLKWSLIVSEMLKAVMFISAVLKRSHLRSYVSASVSAAVSALSWD